LISKNNILQSCLAEKSCRLSKRVAATHIKKQSLTTEQLLRKKQKILKSTKKATVKKPIMSKNKTLIRKEDGLFVQQGHKLQAITYKPSDIILLNGIEFVKKGKRLKRVGMEQEGIKTPAKVEVEGKVYKRSAQGNLILQK
jgi:hypothetical protein